MKSQEKVDVIIIGAGMVGLTLALCLAQNNFTVAVVEANAPGLDWPANALPLRVSAINLHSYNLWQKLNLWPQIEKNAVTLIDKMQVWDAKGGGEITFDSAQAGLSELGFIIENRAVVKAAWQECEKHPNIRLHVPVKGEAIVQEQDHVTLTLANQHDIVAEVLVGADGANSWVRKILKIPIKKRSYQQEALVAVIKVEKPHHNVALQSFLKTGPLGILPLYDPHKMSIVWSAEHGYVKQLLAMDAKLQAKALAEAMQWRLGDAEFLMEPVVFPLMMRHVENYVQSRVALLGDAAHTIHPLAGQGVNLGLKDVACFVEQVKYAKKIERDIGSLRVLRAYERARKGDNNAMLLAMRAFKEGFTFNATWWVYLRSLGLNVTNQQNWLKRFFIAGQ